MVKKRYYFTKESDKSGIKLLKKSFNSGGQSFIMVNLISDRNPITYEDNGKRYRVSLVGSEIHVERLS